jgi:hypothetical protein
MRRQHPPARAEKHEADRQHQRFASQQEHRQAPNNSMSDIGYAALALFVASPVIMAALDLVQWS